MESRDMDTRPRKNAMVFPAKHEASKSHGPEGEKPAAEDAHKEEASVSTEPALNQSTELSNSQKMSDDAQSKNNEQPESQEKKVEEKGLLKNKFSDIVKVTRLANADDPKQKEVILATLKRTEFSAVSLEQISKRVKSIDEPSTFCFQDLGPADDSLLLEDYLHQAHDSIDFKARHRSPKPAQEGQSEATEDKETMIVKCFLYLTPKPVVKDATTAKNLTLDKFVIRVYEWSLAESPGGSRGSLQSSKLDVDDASRMTLANLRKKLATCTKMSVASKTHKFCTKTGETVVDEAMSFSDYLQLEATKSDTAAELPSVQVYYKLAHPKNEPPIVDMASLPGKVVEADHKLTGQQFAGGKVAQDFAVTTRSVEQLEYLKSMTGAATNDYAIDASYLTDTQWAEVLRNCGAMYGWIVDRQKNKITRAPKPAFQLRAKISDDETHAIPDFVPAAPEPAVPALSALRQVSETDMEKARAKVGNWGSRTEMKGNLPGKWTKPKMTKPQEQEEPVQSTELSTAKDDVQPAEPPADAIKEGDTAVPIEDTTVPVQAATTETTEPSASTAQGHGAPAANARTATIEQVASTPALARYLPRVEAGKAVYTVMPSFQVNDDSKIEITVSTHEFETSLAINDFSKHSTEGSITGGYAGFAATISGGFGKDQSLNTKKTDNTYEKTMIAKFLLPRADILLHPADLEPTPELKAALENIRKNKSIADLRKLNQDFGQLWCQRITVGGRLQSSTTMKETTGKTERDEKDAFKMSVGLQVTSPFGGGGGVKHSRESGLQTTTNTTDIKKDERNVFEAVGGDTILAAKPELWASTVADYRTWRVIDRDSLSSLADAISAIPGYGQVRSWFMQAVPTLSKYIELPPSREINLRFKLTAPTSQLSLSYLKKVANYDASGDPIYYLGHSTGGDVRPVKNELAVFNNSLGQRDIINAPALFSPQSYRSPVILGYSSNIVGRSAYGSDYGQDYTNSLWKVSAPFNDALAHGVLVCISTVPAPKPPVTANAPATAAPDASLSLAVFRNQQNVFLPGLSDTSDRHYWRILKHGARVNGEHIKEGDDIYFAWAFKDQTAGFRDFSQDVFGRRRLQFPDDLKGRVLYLKLPWPRFEPLAKPADGAEAVPNSMMLTDDPPAVNNIAQRVAIKTVPGMNEAATDISQGKIATDMNTFGLQDVRFRIDVVGNDGYGDVGDHLLRGLEQQGLKTLEAIDPRLAVMQSLVQMQLKYYETLLFLGK